MDGAPDGEKQTLDEIAAGSRRGLVGELWLYVRTQGKWWLAPILITLLVLGLFVVIGTTGAGPLIYALF